jgi:polar amino acid transport system permease protein
MFNYDWHFERLITYQDAFLFGVLNTIALSSALILFSTILGVLVGIFLRNGGWWTLPLIFLVDIFKGLPPLVLILFGYFALTADVVGITVTAFWSFVFSLGLNVSAFIADLTRASLSNVPREYVEMGTALGLRDKELVRLIIFPLAVRELVPPLSYLYVETIKLTSLASIINVRETVYVAETVITNTARSLEAWIIVGIIYLILVIPGMLLARFLELKFKREVGIAIRHAELPY